MKAIVLILAAAVLTPQGRERLVDLLTKSTGTWVGSPKR